MLLVPGMIYTCENGFIVKVGASNLPYYKFKVDKAWNENGQEIRWLREVWTEDGKAYHFDCGYNFKE